jgi:hypothetical protein
MKGSEKEVLSINTTINSPESCKNLLSSTSRLQVCTECITKPDEKAISEPITTTALSCRICKYSKELYKIHQFYLL